VFLSFQFAIFNLQFSICNDAGAFGECPLTPALSPSAGDREALSSPSGSRRIPLSPAEGERAGVRGHDRGTVKMRSSKVVP